MSFRMLGLFMILPVFSLAAESLTGATPKLIGIALGIYGLSQGLLQMPMGLLSDRFGRKRVIFIGLCVFLVGSLVGATAHTIYMMILARILQGAGAIGSTILAFVADVTTPETRTKAMAVIGMSVGCAFTLAMILGPILNHYLGLSGIFWTTTLLVLIGLFLLTTLKEEHHANYFEKESINQQVHNQTLFPFYFSIFSLHAILTSLFIAIPFVLTRQLLLSHTQQIVLYTLVLVLSFVVAVPLIVIAEKKQKVRTIFLGTIAMLVLSPLTLWILSRTTLVSGIVIIALFLFFIAFTSLEALIPSMVSKTIAPHKKGAAMGVYSSCQFLGIFAGGVIGGVLYEHFACTGVFAWCSGLAGTWFLIMFCQMRLQRTRDCGESR